MHNAILRVAAIGEILWDLFPTGPRFGGAPANFACHAAKMNAEVSMVSGVGTDDLGQQALDALRSHQVNTEFVQTFAHLPTGRVQVTLDGQGQASYAFCENEAWDALRWTDDLTKFASGLDAVCFGTLGQRTQNSHEFVLRLLAATKPNCLRVFDVNLRSPYWSAEIIEASLQRANVLKLNDDEVKIVAELYSLVGAETDVLRQLCRRFELQMAVLTRGADGSCILRGDEVSELPAAETDVVDTVGCGDAFSAAVIIGTLRGFSLQKTHQLACDVASYVCSQSGATPMLPQNLLQQFSLS